MKKIVVVGIGYVGLSNAVLLSQNNKVVLIDILKEKVDLINKKESPIIDIDICCFLKSRKLNLSASLNGKKEYIDADYVIISTPTNYDAKNECFDTESVESVIGDVLNSKSKALIVIKSTIPVGFINEVREKFNTKRIIFSPEFLREGKALYDNLYPSRIVVGEISNRAEKFAALLIEGALKEDIEVLYTDSLEAEAIKLFANTYLAMRVSYFNELDTYSEIKGLDTRKIIKGISLDPRIGDFYNNPSFGYGGYCLPKDSKQLKANYKGVPNDIISDIVCANETRKKFIANSIIDKKPKKIGVYRLATKFDSDNFRSSPIFDIIKILRENDIEIIIYEPTIKKPYEDYSLVNDLDKFKEMSDVILANRITDEIMDVKDKIYTRDIFSRD